MEKYINMNDSFGDKNSVISTKSFRTEYTQCIQNLKEQLQIHKRALYMAEELVEQYKQQNQRLRYQITHLQQQNDKNQQKYQLLQKLFLKFQNQKQKQKIRQKICSKQKYNQRQNNDKFKFQQQINSLSKKITYLEKQLKSIKNYDNKSTQYYADSNLQKIQINIPIYKKGKQWKYSKNKKQKTKSDYMVGVYLQSQRGGCSSNIQKYIDERYNKWLIDHKSLHKLHPNAQANLQKSNSIQYRKIHSNNTPNLLNDRLSHSTNSKHAYNIYDDQPTPNKKTSKRFDTNYDNQFQKQYIMKTLQKQNNRKGLLENYNNRHKSYQ